MADDSVGNSILCGQFSREDFIDMIGEGFHTAMRKVTDCQQADTIWHQIQKMPMDDWAAVLDFVASGFDGLFNWYILPKPGRTDA